MPEQPANDEQAEIKKRAMQRLAVAASLVAAAVVALTLLNYKKPETPQPVTASTAPVMEQPALVQPEAATEKPQEEEKPAEPPVQPGQPSPVPETAAAPATPPAPPPPQVFNKTGLPAAANAKPRAETTAAHPMLKPPNPEGPKPEKATVQATAAQQPAPATSVATEQKQPLTVLRQPAKQVAEPAPAKAYAVQLGLFSNPDNALQLQKRLAEHGIKSYTETRLQVGPFQTKAEAEQALVKIRSLGINAVLAPVR